MSDSRKLLQSYNLRTKGDYATIYALDKQELLEMYNEMREFVAELERFLKS
jgi:CRP-like cAMP-binding protein